MSQTGTIPYYNELHDALTQPGCAFCRLLDKAANVQIDSMLWERVNDPKNQEVLKQSRGYCHHHGWMLVRSGAALSITILMKSVMDTLIDVLARHDGTQIEDLPLHQLRHALNLPHTEPTAQLVAELSPQVACPICTDLQKLEHGYASTLLDHLTGPDSLAATFEQSAGLCLLHFRRVLLVAMPGEALNTLLAIQQTIWQQLHDELAEFVRKNDYRFSDEPVGEEGNAWRRALAVISGPPPQQVGQGGGLTSGLTG